jgi:hypothetical protein
MSNDGQTSTPAGTFALVAAGHRHTCAVTTAGEMQCWDCDDFKGPKAGYWNIYVR